MKRSSVLTLSFLLSFSSLQAGGAAVRDWDHEWLNGAVFYQVFVRSFSDSDGDGIGDLRGLISKLDYLNDGDPTTTGDLGVQGLWLMPIFPSPSYHGYDVTDYTTIKPDYGDLDDFHDLVAEAERRGIRIILDLAINHTSSEHPWFVDAADSGTHRNWYVWS
jgi:glycosidase